MVCVLAYALVRIRARDVHLQPRLRARFVFMRVWVVTAAEPMAVAGGALAYGVRAGMVGQPGQVGRSCSM